MGDVVGLVMAESGSERNLAAELASRWTGQLQARSWDERLNLLNDIHDHLREVIPDFDKFCQVFPQFIAELVARLGDMEIRSEAQAHVFANSAAAEHRKAAGAWLSRHQRSRP